MNCKFSIYIMDQHVGHPVIQLRGNSSCGKASQHKHAAALRLSIPDFGVFAIPVVLPFQACAMWANTRNNDWTASGSCEQTGELWQHGERFPKLSTNQCHRHLINDNQSHKSHRHTRRTQLIKSKTSCPFIFMNGRVRMPASFIHLPAKRCPCLQPFLGKMWSPLNGIHVPR